MEEVGDIIPSILSYTSTPVSYMGVSKQWKKSIEYDAAIATKNLNKRYDGTMRTLDGKIYNTLYTKLKEAIQALDVEIIRPIIVYTGYIPIPWDLLAFDVAAIMHTKPGKDPIKVYNIISQRWSKYGHAAYMLAYTDEFNLSTDIPLSGFKPYVSLKNDSSTIERTHTISSVFHAITTQEQLEITIYTPIIYGIDTRIKDTLGDTLSEALGEYKTSVPAQHLIAGLYANMYKVDQKVIDWLFEDSGGIAANRAGHHYPEPPLFLSLDEAIELDRPDLIELLPYKDDTQLVYEMYDLHKYNLKERMVEYLNNRMPKWRSMLFSE